MFILKFFFKKKKKKKKKMDEAKAINKITVNLPKVKVDFINDTH